MGHLGRIVPPKLASMVIRNGPTLKDIVPRGMGRLGRKVGAKGDRRTVIGAGNRHFPSIKGFKAPNSHEQGRGELPDVAAHLGALPPLPRLLTGPTVPSFNLCYTAFRMKPVLEGLSLTGDLEDIEGLPFIIFCMTLITLNRLAHHAEEEINDRAHIAMSKGGPTIQALFGHRL